MATLTWFLWVGPNLLTRVLIKEKQREIKHTEKETQCDYGDRVWNDVATSQQWHAATRH